MKFNWKRLYKSLEDNSQGLSWRKLAKTLGLTPSIFTRISKGKPVSVKNLIKLLKAVDRQIWYYVDEKARG